MVIMEDTNGLDRTYRRISMENTSGDISVFPIYKLNTGVNQNDNI